MNLSMLWRRRWKASLPVKQTDSKKERVTVKLEGIPFWFESSDVSLYPSMEAFASAFLPIALYYRRKITVEGSLDATWIRNAQQLVGIWSDWWRYPSEFPLESSAPKQQTDSPKEQIGCFFSGGVDSFWTLLRGGHQLDYLIFIHGFDIPLWDQKRVDAFERSLNIVAAETGKRVIRVKSNLRNKFLFRRTNWERTHGAVLAAVGHLLVEHLGKMIIPPSSPRWYLWPWGSHPQTDPLWSSSKISFVHDSIELGRLGRIAEIIDEPLVQQHLRVCWENRTPTGNCSRCIKCLSTMVAIDGYGKLDKYSVFDQSEPLAERLESIRKIGLYEQFLFYQFLEKLDLSRSVREAVLRLIKRSLIKPFPVFRRNR